MRRVPVITVDGPSGAGKGTISHMLAETLGWHFLDSGALYRVTGQACLIEGVSWDDHPAVTEIARHLDVSFQRCRRRDSGGLQGAGCQPGYSHGGRGPRCLHRGRDSAVREALLRASGSSAAPGLVADGRDMGTVVFPDAPLKFFLTASAEERAERRYKQLIAKGENVSLPRLLEDIKERDARDSSRAVSPLVPAEDAIVIDSTAIPIEDVFAR